MISRIWGNKAMKGAAFSPLLLVLFLNIHAYSQDLEKGDEKEIRSAFPFLLINTDARSGGMGNAGVAIIDCNPLSSNPAKASFIEDAFKISFSYNPLMTSVADHIFLSQLSGFLRINERQVLGASLRYFSMGTFELTDDQKNSQGIFQPNEFATDISYSQQFGDDFSIAESIRYIHSGLQTSSLITNGQETTASAFSFDISAFFKKNVNLWGKDNMFALGTYISNIGPKVTYSNSGSEKDFLPMNLRLGASTTFMLDNLSKLTYGLDFNKLLVPAYTDEESDLSVSQAIFNSFTDASGGFKEEMSEIMVSNGLEYTYNNLFSLRIGHNYESPGKGNNTYFTFGTGVRYKSLIIDACYLTGTPTPTILSKSLKVSLSVAFN